MANELRARAMQDWPGLAAVARGETTLATGAHGREVTALQEALAAIGVWVTVDGVLGAETAAALARFQRACGLPATGVLDAVTAGALNGRLVEEEAAREVEPGPRLLEVDARRIDLLPGFADLAASLEPILAVDAGAPRGALHLLGGSVTCRRAIDGDAAVDIHVERLTTRRAPDVRAVRDLLGTVAAYVGLRHRELRARGGAERGAALVSLEADLSRRLVALGAEVRVSVARDGNYTVFLGATGTF